MALFGRLWVLPILLALLTATKGDDSGSMESGEVLEMLDDTLETMRVTGCLPDDYVSLELPSCEQVNGGVYDKILCVAKSAGFANESGSYNAETATTFIGSLSSDEQWVEATKATLNSCSSMMSDELPDNRQGVFMFACLVMSLKFQCNAKRTGDAMQSIIGTEGQSIGQALAYIAEGYCVTGGLKNPDSIDEWTACSEQNSLDLEVLAEAGEAYKKFAYTSEEVDIDADDINALSDQLDNFNATIHCTMTAIGEITADGELDFDRMRENLNISKGKYYIKKTAAGVLDFCQGMSPATPNDFVTCWFGSLPHACISLKAHGLVLAPEKKPSCPAGGRGGRGRGGRGRGGRTQRRRNQRRRNQRRRNQRRRQRPQQPAEEI